MWQEPVLLLRRHSAERFRSIHGRCAQRRCTQRQRQPCPTQGGSMKNTKRIVCIAALIGAALLFAVGVCAGSNGLPTQAALPSRASSGECFVAAITVTGKLGVSPGGSDTLGGSATNRVVDFFHPNPSGTITV